MSKTSPTSGTTPIEASTTTFQAIRAISHFGAPSRCASRISQIEIPPLTKSPIPGTRPMMASSPNRIFVPGSLNCPSNSSAKACNCSIRACRSGFEITSGSAGVVLIADFLVSTEEGDRWINGEGLIVFICADSRIERDSCMPQRHSSTRELIDEVPMQCQTA